jgi:septal ring factor EnvC (AmiA/AmiB activator)
MQEATKNKLLLILSVVAVLFFLGMAKSCGDAYLQKKMRDKEIARRLDLEEKLDRINRDKGIDSDKLKGLNAELEMQKNARQEAETALVQQQLEAKELQEELEKINQQKKALEEDLQEALEQVKKGSVAVNE